MTKRRIDADHDRIRELIGKGLTRNQVRERLGVSLFTIARAIDPEIAERHREHNRARDRKAKQARRGGSNG